MKQRKGRAGRLFEGTVIRFVTGDFFDKRMEDFDRAEIMRVPLEQIVLRVKLLFQHFGSLKGAFALLRCDEGVERHSGTQFLQQHVAIVQNSCP